jgi:hypothetical protein
MAVIDGVPFVLISFDLINCLITQALNQVFLFVEGLANICSVHFSENVFDDCFDLALKSLTLSSSVLVKLLLEILGELFA